MNWSHHSLFTNIVRVYVSAGLEVDVGGLAAEATRASGPRRVEDIIGRDPCVRLPLELRALQYPDDHIRHSNLRLHTVRVHVPVLVRVCIRWFCNYLNTAV